MLRELFLRRREALLLVRRAFGRGNPNAHSLAHRELTSDDYETLLALDRNLSGMIQIEA